VWHSLGPKFLVCWSGVSSASLDLALKIIAWFQIALNAKVSKFIWNWTGVSSLVSLAAVVATHYALDDPADRNFPSRRDQPRSPPSLPYSGYRVFPRGKMAGGIVLTTRPLIAPSSEWVGATPPPLRCTWVGITWGNLYLCLVFLELLVHTCDEPINFPSIIYFNRLSL